MPQHLKEQCVGFQYSLCSSSLYFTAVDAMFVQNGQQMNVWNDFKAHFVATNKPGSLASFKITSRIYVVDVFNVAQN